MDLLIYEGYEACSSSVQGELHDRQSSRSERGNGIAGDVELVLGGDGS